MIVVLMKEGKRKAAFYNPRGEGYIEIDYDSPLATPYKLKLA